MMPLSGSAVTANRRGRKARLTGFALAFCLGSTVRGEILARVGVQV